MNNLTDQLAKERKERKEAAVAGKAGVEGTEAAAAAAAAKKGKEKGKEKEKEAGQARTKPNRYPTGIQSNRGPWWVPRPPQRWDHGTSTNVLSMIGSKLPLPSYADVSAALMTHLAFNNRSG